MADIPLRDLLGTFSSAVSATLSVGPGLDALVQEANRVLGAKRTSVWLHDRRARALALAATSLPDSSAPTRTSTEDRETPAGRGLRLEHPQVFREANQTVLLAPLRGWRRALGTIVIENPTFTDEARLLTQIDELARQLSVGVENVQLLEQVLSQRQQLAQSEKLASLGRFVAGIAHEITTRCRAYSATSNC
jgi:GAF domain-containing protein